MSRIGDVARCRAACQPSLPPRHRFTTVVEENGLSHGRPMAPSLEPHSGTHAATGHAAWAKLVSVENFDWQVDPT